MWLFYDINEFCRKASFKIGPEKKRKKTRRDFSRASHQPRRDRRAGMKSQRLHSYLFQLQHNTNVLMPASSSFFFMAEITFSPGSTNQDYKKKKNSFKLRREDIDKWKCPEAFLQTPALDKPVIKVWFTGTSAAVEASRLQMRQGSIRLNLCREMTVASAWLLAPKIHSWGWLSIGFGNVYIKLIIVYAVGKIEHAVSSY